MTTSIMRETGFCIGLAGGLRAQRLIPQSDYIEEVTRAEQMRSGFVSEDMWRVHEEAHRRGWAQAYEYPVIESITGAWKLPPPSTCDTCHGTGYMADNEGHAVPCDFCGDAP